LEFISNNGSIQNIRFENYIDTNNQYMVERINHIKDKYKTIYEIKQRDLIDMSADRAPFIDQTQSLNLYMAEDSEDSNLPPLSSRLSSALIYGHSKGLKTGMYYLRSKAISTGAKHLAIDVSKLKKDNGVLPPIENVLNNNDNTTDNSSPFECVGCSA
jgi:ribonucleotide reductase alpha subunit